MRWKEMTVGLALTLAALVGCKQNCFLTECDYKHYHEMGLPDRLECDPSASVVAAGSDMAAPTTVLDPERPIRHLTLAEALAMALEKGTPGSPALNGTTNDSLATFQRPGVISPENAIRVLALEPAIVGADIENSLAKFDARWITSMNWTTTDQPVGGSFLNNFQNGNRATFSSAVVKPLPTGGLAGITFNTAYTNLTNPPPGVVNPVYRPLLQFAVDQPLLQGFGTEINQLRASLPGATPGGPLPNIPQGGRVEGILITRLRFDEQRAEFERQVHVMLLNVEVAYWNLYGTYWTLYSREQALRQAFEAWKINKARYEAGKIAIQDFAQTRGQYELFRGQRLTALEGVLDAEHQLRGLIGLAVEDGTRIVPADEPTLSPYQPDWNVALNEALALRPELILARNDLKFRQLDLINQKNLLLPDLRAFASYDINGIGGQLDGGSNPNNALHSLASDKFNDWSIGLRLDVPIGYREAHAGLRIARLRLGQSYSVLRDQENKAARFLAQEYRTLTQQHQLVQAQRAQREAGATQLEARFREFLAGKGTLDILLEAQRVWADALQNEYAAIVAYNNALATFEYAKGTIMQHDSIFISEGMLPKCAQVRAVEHESQRSKALVLRERANPVNHQPCLAEKGMSGLPELPPTQSPSLPSLFEGHAALPKTPETLPTGPDTQSGVTTAPSLAHRTPSLLPIIPDTTKPAAASLLMPVYSDVKSEKSTTSPHTNSQSALQPSSAPGSDTVGGAPRDLPSSGSSGYKIP